LVGARSRRSTSPAGRESIVCDVAGLDRPGLAVVDALARLALEARRAGLEMRLVHASPELVELLELAGLDAVVPRVGPSGVEPRR
jgi:anti-anti-sigma regulatory factor